VSASGRSDTKRQYGEVDVREFRASDGAAVLALEERGLAATALGGWDGRRGWLFHVAVRLDQL
jgi:hypothetical protein